MTTELERIVICHACNLPIDIKNVAHSAQNGKLFHNECFVGRLSLAGGKAQAKELGALMVEQRRNRIWV